MKKLLFAIAAVGLLASTAPAEAAAFAARAFETKSRSIETIGFSGSDILRSSSRVWGSGSGYNRKSPVGALMNEGFRQGANYMQKQENDKRREKAKAEAAQRRAATEARIAQRRAESEARSAQRRAESEQRAAQRRAEMQARWAARK